MDNFLIYLIIGLLIIVIILLFRISTQMSETEQFLKAHILNLKIKIKTINEKTFRDRSSRFVVEWEYLC